MKTHLPQKPRDGWRHTHLERICFFYLSLLALAWSSATEFSLQLSVLSASGGIKVNHPKLSNDVVVIMAVVILIGLFSMQHYGIDKVAWMFAPIVLAWFLLIGGIDIFNICKYDRNVLKALSPIYIYRYLKRGGRTAWNSLGGIMLSITGTEALFADLAFFPLIAIQFAFTTVVFPCLLLAYFGQAAYLMNNKEHVSDAFYRSIPGETFIMYNQAKQQVKGGNKRELIQLGTPIFGDDATNQSLKKKLQSFEGSCKASRSCERTECETSDK